MAGKKRKPGSAVRSPLAGRILQQRDRGETDVSLERLEADLADVSRYDLVASLKELEKAGKGQFLVGRKGKKSRFVWKDKDKPERGEKAERDAASAAPVAAPATKSDASEAAETPEEGAAHAPKGLARKVLVPVGRRLDRPRLSAHDPAEPVARLSGRGRSLQHSFHLRPGLQVSIDLPEDVTALEIERFCTFLQAIPFAGSGRS